jgi:seryl-tRNA synthetase
MKSVIPWLCAVLFAGTAAYLFSAGSRKDADLAALRAQATQAENLHSELEAARTTIAAQTTELTRLQKDNEDVLRLRNEVRQLRDQTAQLSKQAQAAQSASVNAQQQALQLRDANLRLQASQKQNEQAQQTACINQLRQIEAAKQQWALEFHKNLKDTPTSEEIARYLGGGPMPACPSGGTYVIGTVEVLPTCSTPGHTLGQTPPAAR